MHKMLEELSQARQKNIEIVKNQQILLSLKHEDYPSIDEPNTNSTDSEMLLIAKTIADRQRKNSVEIKRRYTEIKRRYTELDLESDTQSEVVGDSISVVTPASQTSLTQRMPRIPPKTNKTAEARKAALTQPLKRRNWLPNSASHSSQQAIKPRASTTLAC